tara:strand:+ start:50 stop:415 length:366 start_codon:yes stop_codon:yes gene_type:complete
MKVAVIRTSQDRGKFWNKAVRAYVKHSDAVYPVNPNCPEIEGIPACKSVLDIPDDLDRITRYLPLERTITVLNDIAKKRVKEIFFNPGSENNAVVRETEELGLNFYLACSIVNIGLDPNEL